MRCHYSKGFTILEVIVMIGIFAFISGLLLANYRGNSRVQNLRAAAQEIAARVREVQGLAYSSKEQEICDADGLVCRSGSACDAGYPTGCVKQYVTRYGLAFDVDGAGKQYAVFADYGTLGAYSPGEAVPNGLVTLPAGVEISSVAPLVNNPVLYVYNAANASPFISCSVDCTTTITLRETATNATRTVVIQKQTGTVTVR